MTSVLTEHLVKGYTLNQKRLAEKGVGEVRQMLAATLKGPRLVGDKGVVILDIITYFAKNFIIKDHPFSDGNKLDRIFSFSIVSQEEWLAGCRHSRQQGVGYFDFADCIQ